MKVYLSGPMTIRKDDCYNFMEFFFWEKVLRMNGYKVVNPARLDCERMLAGETYSDDLYDELLAEDLRIIREDGVDALFMLKGWELSDGAKEEYAVAKELGLEVWYEDREDRPRF